MKIPIKERLYLHVGEFVLVIVTRLWCQRGSVAQRTSALLERRTKSLQTDLLILSALISSSLDKL